MAGNNRRLNTTELLLKIERLTKERMAAEPIVELDRFRNAKKKLHPKTILIIEDDPTVRTVYERVLGAEGYVLKMASDATELSLILDGSPFDLIILDIGLPWINGFELAQMMREHKDLSKLPIIFVSGQSSEEEMKKAFAVGAQDFIPKPFDISVLRKTVATLLKLNG